MAHLVMRQSPSRNADNRQSMRRTIIKQGYLKKLPNAAKIGAVFKKPERRWFIFGVMNMREPYLEYYDSEDSIFEAGHPINILFLTSCTHVARAASSSRYSHMFIIMMSERELRLVAPTRQIMKEWCDALEGQLSELGIIGEPGTGENDYVVNPVSRPLSRLEQTRGQASQRSSQPRASHGRTPQITTSRITIAQQRRALPSPLTAITASPPPAEETDSNVDNQANHLAEERSQAHPTTASSTNQNGVTTREVYEPIWLPAQSGEALVNGNENSTAVTSTLPVYSQPLRRGDRPPQSTPEVTSTDTEVPPPGMDTTDSPPTTQSPAASAAGTQRPPALRPFDFPMTPAGQLVSLPSFEEACATPSHNNCPLPYTQSSEHSEGAMGGDQPDTPMTPWTPLSPLTPKAMEAMGGGDDAVGGWNMPPPENMEAPPPYIPKKMLERNANRSITSSQVEKLRSEMQGDGVQVGLRRVDCYHALGLVDCLDRVWVAGWNQKARPYLGNAFHIGDQIVSVNNQVVENARMAHKLIKHCSEADQVTFSIARLPMARVYAIKRTVNGESLGLTRKGGTAEIVTVHPEGLVAHHGVTAKTMALNGSDFTNWWLTEINHRPLNLTFKKEEIERRLNAVGKDISIVIQPTDFIQALKSCLKSTYKNYTDFMVQ